MPIAITRPVSRSIVNCELTHIGREPIDYGRAQDEHYAYERLLEKLGCRVQRLAAADDLPDAVFVEDAAVVLDELAVITRPGAKSRRPETAAVAEALKEHRPLVSIEPPGQLEGGDVMRVGRTVFIGLSARTNREGIDQFKALAAPFDYDVRAVRVSGCLHLKSAVSEIAEGTLLINRGWLDDAPFAHLRLIDVAHAEMFAANALRIGDSVIYPSCFPATQRRLETEGIAVSTVDVTELRKAEAGVTCCSLIFRE